MLPVFYCFMVIIFGEKTAAIQSFLSSKKASNEGLLALRLWV
jgi:hypothetical protein